MAAGDIIIPNNTITPEILERISSEVKNSIASTSKDPDQYEEVNSLAGITSIPVFQQSGSNYKLVRVLLSILKGNAGVTPDITLRVNTIEYGTTPTVDKTGTPESPIITIGLPGGKNGEKIIPIRTATGINYKYEGQEDSAAQPLFSFADVMPDVSDFSPEGIALLQKPATDAAKQVTDKMAEIETNVDQAVVNANKAKDAADQAAKNAQSVADNVQDGKTPVMDSVSAISGNTPSGSFIRNGVDASGNPKYVLNLTLPKGKDGQPAIFETGTTTTIAPAEQASVDVVENGSTAEGNPKYILNFSIPRGQQGLPGTGSGNVSAEGTGLVSGKKYLFVPGSNGSTAGSFIEYIEPIIPEQVQPDWNATAGKGVILNKPGNATANISGLMSPAQFEKLEKLNPDDYTAADILTKLKTVDGPESGLDADLLDGKQAAEFALKTDIPTVDSDLSSTSTNPVQNKAIQNVINTLATDLGDRISRVNSDLEQTKVGEAPNDGKEYVRKNSSWVENSINTATQSAAGLMSATDKQLVDFYNGSNTVSTLSSLPTSKHAIYASISTNQSLSVASGLTPGRSLQVFVYNTGSTDRTITLPTTGAYQSMSGSSITLYGASGKDLIEINIYCYSPNKYSIRAGGAE